MLTRTAQKRPRPKRYTPTQVERVCASLLSNQQQFMHCDSDTFPVTWLRFINPVTNAHINYFSTVKDMENPRYPYPNARAWLHQYIIELNHGIHATDITILPLVLVKNDRRHFNTIVISGTRDDNGIKLSIKIIEPKSHNEYNKFKIFPGMYPIDSLITNIIDEFKTSNQQGLSVDVDHLRVGVQSIFNNNDCGAHHINTAEVVSSMSIDEVQNISTVLARLRMKSLSARNNDGLILDSVNDCEDLASICNKLSPNSSAASLVSNHSAQQPDLPDHQPESYTLQAPQTK